MAELLELGFEVGEIAAIWRAAGLPLGPLEREIQRITGDPRPLPTPMPSHGRRIECALPAHDPRYDSEIHK